MTDSTGSRLKVTLTASKQGQATASCRLQFTPTTTGAITIKVEQDGMDLAGSPLTLTVKPAREKGEKEEKEDKEKKEEKKDEGVKLEGSKEDPIEMNLRPATHKDDKVKAIKTSVSATIKQEEASNMQRRLSKQKESKSKKAKDTKVIETEEDD